MKSYSILIVILSFYACSNPQKKEGTQTIIQQPEKIDTLIQSKKEKIIQEEITFSERNGEAVLIGEKIELLNTDLEIVADISNLTGEIVKIKGVSDSLFNQGKGFEEFCKSFWYVKIQNDTMNGVVNGRQVFEIQNSNQDTSFIIDSNKIEILTTDFLGMGVDYEGELMGCPVNQPILIKDKKNNYFKLVDLIQNEYSKKARLDDEYPFFALRSDDGCYDKIDSIIADGTEIRLKIHRRWQEGENDYEVLLNFVDSTYKAKYLNFGEINYE